jgi:SAM-dependent methyltransferase
VSYNYVEYVDPGALMPARLQTMFRHMAKAAQHERNQSGYHYGNTSFPYIPACLSSFEQALRQLLKDGMHVIDVGCGAGDKLWTFHALNPRLRITGIEHDATMARCARYICRDFATIIEGDALVHDYKPYDLIYMYRPMISADMQTLLQEQVMSTMRIGATLVVFYAEMQNTRTDQPFPDQLERGWVKTVPYKMKPIPAYRKRRRQ